MADESGCAISIPIGSGTGTVACRNFAVTRIIAVMLDAEGVLELLAELGIAHRTWTHAPVFTVDEAKAERGDLEGAHIKNLFLRNKKGRMWLVTCLEDRRLDLRRLGSALGAGRLSFASVERLSKHLGVIPGAVTPLAVVNDTQGLVELVLDKAIFGHPLVNVHPILNSMTTALHPEDLLRYAEHTGHPGRVVDLGEFLD